MFIIGSGGIELTRVIHSTSRATQHLNDAVKKLHTLKLLSSPSNHSIASGASTASNTPRRSSYDLVESALESVKQGLKSHASLLSRRPSNVATSESIDDDQGAKIEDVSGDISSSSRQMHTAPKGAASTKDSDKESSTIANLPHETATDKPSPPLILRLGPGDFFGEAAVLGLKQTTSAQTMEYSCFQVSFFF